MLQENKGDILPMSVNKSLLVDVMPQYQMRCKKCGETVPCHWSWFENSKVLCPSCYATMNEIEIMDFHQSHPEKTAEFSERKIGSVMPLYVNENTKGKDEIFDTTGGVLSSGAIMYSPKHKLIAAVKNGRLSKTRFRMEMRRREHEKYFRNLPDVETIAI